MTERYCPPETTPLSLCLSWTGQKYFTLHFGPRRVFFFFPFLFLSSCWVWLVFTVKYCSVLQMYFRCAMQSSGVRLMMFFTFPGDQVTKLGWIRNCSMKLYFVKSFSCSCHNCCCCWCYCSCTSVTITNRQNPSNMQCLWMQRWMHNSH